jgi:hypothetical protein
MSEPLPVTHRIQLYSFDATAGSDGRRTREAWIDFGKASVQEAKHEDLARLANEVGRDRWDFSLVSFFFDLQPLQKASYQLVRVTLTFCDNEVIAKYLAPSPYTDMLGFDGHADARGLGRPVVSWDLKPGDDQGSGVPPASHPLLCLLQRPRSLAHVDVKVEVEALIHRTAFVFERREARTEEPSRYRLSFETGAFDQLPN